MDECRSASFYKESIFIKKAYYDEPSFRDSKVVFSIYDDGFKSNFVENFNEQLKFKEITSDDLNYATLGNGTHEGIQTNTTNTMINNEIKNRCAEIHHLLLEIMKRLEQIK